MNKFLSVFFALLFVVCVVMFWSPYMVYAFLGMFVSLGGFINFYINYLNKSK